MVFPASETHQDRADNRNKMAEALRSFNSTTPVISLQKLLACDFCQRSIATHLTNHSHSTCLGVPLLNSIVPTDSVSDICATQSSMHKITQVVGINYEKFRLFPAAEAQRCGKCGQVFSRLNLLLHLFFHCHAIPSDFFHIAAPLPKINNILSLMNTRALPIQFRPLYFSSLSFTRYSVSFLCRSYHLQ